MIPEELRVPYAAEAIPLTDLGSGAIVEYLIERYDPSYQLSFAPGTPDAYHAKQWLFVQASGQGPYYGQYGWFRLFAPEAVPLALERYASEVNRVTAVLEGHLSKQKEGEEWLVRGRCSYVDIACVSWQTTIAKVSGKEEYDEDAYPHVKAWIGRMLEREGVRRGFESKQVLH